MFVRDLVQQTSNGTGKLGPLAFGAAADKAEFFDFGPGDIERATRPREIAGIAGIV